ncbi:MAG: phosphodiesterase [Eubacteriales bacterium]|nr:phosphodiesterase [Eubacteriales bacterium]
MKYMFASDIHGSAYFCGKMAEAYQKEGAERLVLLGDLLYHGPRNDLPREYAPKKVISMLNDLKDQIYAVRGNCEAEVDQMVLEFPVMADYAVLVLGGTCFYATHGHIFHKDNLPPMREGDVLIHGHTHVWKAERLGSLYWLNPGSVSIPKEGNPPTYGLFTWEEGAKAGRRFEIKDLEGNVIKSLEL